MPAPDRSVVPLAEFGARGNRVDRLVEAALMAIDSNVEEFRRRISAACNDGLDSFFRIHTNEVVAQLLADKFASQREASVRTGMSEPAISQIVARKRSTTMGRATALIKTLLCDFALLEPGTEEFGQRGWLAAMNHVRRHWLYERGLLEKYCGRPEYAGQFSWVQFQWLIESDRARRTTASYDQTTTRRTQDIGEMREAILRRTGKHMVKILGESLSMDATELRRLNDQWSDAFFLSAEYLPHIWVTTKNRGRER
jgi:hypothetical protein